MKDPVAEPRFAGVKRRPVAGERVDSAKDVLDVTHLPKLNAVVQQNKSRLAFRSGILYSKLLRSQYLAKGVGIGLSGVYEKNARRMLSSVSSCHSRTVVVEGRVK